MSDQQPNNKGPYDRAVQYAVGDLARSLGADRTAIEVLEHRRVTWTSSALGCPEPDQMYLQAIVPGVLIRLRHDDQEYRYHGGRNTPPFRCECASPEAPGPTMEDED